MSHGTVLDCGCYIRPEGGRVWCPTCADGGPRHVEDPRVARLEEALRRIVKAWEDDGPMSPVVRDARALLSPSPERTILDTPGGNHLLIEHFAAPSGESPTPATLGAPLRERMVDLIGRYVDACEKMDATDIGPGTYRDADDLWKKIEEALDAVFQPTSTHREAGDTRAAYERLHGLRPRTPPSSSERRDEVTDEDARRTGVAHPGLTDDEFLLDFIEQAKGPGGLREDEVTRLRLIAQRLRQIDYDRLRAARKGSPTPAPTTTGLPPSSAGSEARNG